MQSEFSLNNFDELRAEHLRTIHENLALLNGVSYDEEEWKILGERAVERLMLALREREAAGVGILIDSQTLQLYENLAETPFPPIYNDEDYDADDEEDDNVQTLKQLEALKKTAQANFAQCLTLMKGQIEDLCRGCSYHRTIRATEEGIRCDCLSESFFPKHLQQHRCPLKNIK